MLRLITDTDDRRGSKALIDVCLYILCLYTSVRRITKQETHQEMRYLNVT